MSKTQHPITDELLDQLLANYQNPEDLVGADGILKQLTKKLVERALDAELTHHLGHGKHQPVTIDEETAESRPGRSCNVMSLIDEESRCVISHTLLDLSLGTTSNLHGSHHHIGAAEDLIHFIHRGGNVAKAHYYWVVSS